MKTDQDLKKADNDHTALCLFSLNLKNSNLYTDYDESEKNIENETEINKVFTYLDQLKIGSTSNKTANKEVGNKLGELELVPLKNNNTLFNPITNNQKPSRLIYGSHFILDLIYELANESISSAIKLAISQSFEIFEEFLRILTEEHISKLTGDDFINITKHSVALYKITENIEVLHQLGFILDHFPRKLVLKIWPSLNDLAILVSKNVLLRNSGIYSMLQKLINVGNRTKRIKQK